MESSLLTEKLDRAQIEWILAASRDQIRVCFEIGMVAAKMVSVKPKQIAQAIGATGERVVINSLSDRFGSSAVINKSTTAASGDIELIVGGRVMMIEVKNWTSTVPIKEVDKFQRDIQLSRVSAGLFV